MISVLIRKPELTVTQNPMTNRQTKVYSSKTTVTTETLDRPIYLTRVKGLTVLRIPKILNQGVQTRTVPTLLFRPSISITGSKFFTCVFG